jgi:hypothetical protein
MSTTDFEIIDGLLASYNGNDKIVLIPNSVTLIKGGAFSECDGVETVIIESPDITISANAFKDCKTLKKVEFGTGNVKIKKGAFDGCIKLKMIEISENTEIEDGTFDDLTELTRIIFTKGTKRITSIPHLKRVNDIIIPSTVTYISEGAFGNYAKSIYAMTVKPFFGYPKGWHKHFCRADAGLVWEKKAKLFRKNK